MPDFDRISVHPGRMGGKPTIRGTRTTVALIVGQLAQGRTVEALLADYGHLSREDIPEALRYAAALAETSSIGAAEIAR